MKKLAAQAAFNPLLASATGGLGGNSLSGLTGSGGLSGVGGVGGDILL